MAIMKTKSYKWLLWANLVTVPTSLVIALLLSLVLKDAAGFVAIIFVPLFIAMWVVLVIDAVVGIKIIYRKLAGKT